MLFGCTAIALSHFAARLADRVHLSDFRVLVLTLCAIASYAMWLAPATWVLITEIFPNRIHASALSVSAPLGCVLRADLQLSGAKPCGRNLGTISGVWSICVAGESSYSFPFGRPKGRSVESM
jgi:hypothetical protein